MALNTLIDLTIKKIFKNQTVLEQQQATKRIAGTYQWKEEQAQKLLDELIANGKIRQEQYAHKKLLKPNY